MSNKIIRVVTTVTLDIDATQWAEAYGLEAEKSAEIRDDVKEYVRASVESWFREQGFLDKHNQVNA